MFHFVFQVQTVRDDRLLLCATTNHYYNRGVLTTFDAISNLPQTICGLYDKAIDQLNIPPQKSETKPAK